MPIGRMRKFTQPGAGNRQLDIREALKRKPQPLEAEPPKLRKQQEAGTYYSWVVFGCAQCTLRSMGWLPSSIRAISLTIEAQSCLLPDSHLKHTFQQWHKRFLKGYK